MNDNGWITVKRTRRRAKTNVSSQQTSFVDRTGKRLSSLGERSRGRFGERSGERSSERSSERSGYDHQDYNVVVFRKPHGKKKNGPRTARHKSGTHSYAHAVEKKANEGSYACKKYDRKFITSVINARVKMGLKQAELNQKWALPSNTIKNLESGKLVYNPNMKQRIQNKLARTSNVL